MKTRGTLSWLTVVALSWGCNGAENTVGPPVSRPPHAVILASSPVQDGKAGERGARPLVVRVVDAEGEPLHLVKVFWMVTGGTGEFIDRALGEAPAPYQRVVREGTRLHTRTGRDGLAQVYFAPSKLGAATVAASVEVNGGPVDGSPIEFSIDVNTVIISFGFGHDAWEASECFEDEWWLGRLDLEKFLDPTCSNNVSIPFGASVEWVNHLPRVVHVGSTSVPPAGRQLDSGELLRLGRFPFEPSVAGTWHFRDVLGSAIGTLTVRPSGPAQGRAAPSLSQGNER